VTEPNPRGADRLPSGGGALRPDGITTREAARPLEELHAAELRIRAELPAAVAVARAAGASWADIGTALGMSRQAAHERFGRH
jgi:hypothetical protein